MNIIARFEFGLLCATLATEDEPKTTLVTIRRADGSTWQETYPAPPPQISAGDCISMLALALAAAERNVNCMVSVDTPLTRSEVALARVVAAWEGFPSRADDRGSEAMHAVHAALFDHGLVDNDELTPEGRELLVRARRDGGLDAQRHT